MSCRLSPFGSICCLLLRLGSDDALLAGAPQRSECRVSGRHMTSVCPTAGDVNFDGLAKVVSAGSPRCEVTISPFKPCSYD